jgi:acetyltransferase-like isoleucine patch superfamily enzyme
MIRTKIIYPFIESIIRNISGGIGQRIRYQYYKRRFKSCGVNVKIDEGVIFQTPENMSIGSDVWFLPFSIITARGLNTKINDRILHKKKNKSFNISIGSIQIGNEVSIGAYNYIQGMGGLIIEDRVTTSARVSIFSFSHYPYDENDPSRITYANSMVKSSSISCIESPIVLMRGVWLGLNVIILGGTIGENSFVTSNSVVLDDLKENSYAHGSPAKKIKKRFQ